MVEIEMGVSGKIYDGCEIETVGGRKTLTTPPEVAANIVGENVQALVDATPANERQSVTLTGPMAVWAYLIVFHIVVHQFARVYYKDGRGLQLLVAQH